MVLKIGVPAVIVGWVMSGALLFTSVQNIITFPVEYEWVKQVVPLIPVLAGHHVLAWRYHTRDN